ncbi:hypothetical protein CCHR01_14328 [Colletotrichum chrysophilum]|uniref:EKC/KEOPS complex subunit BUD32 n=1 Tax=Colletotrichum chrysophilum TaxID=1836956 RepID=A0AAD9A7R6_9PEZI|nr:hypothetical protein CCHR01_14328 [Colletotrichum chrysophilum]
MSDRTEQFRNNPIGEALHAVRSTFKSLCDAINAPCSPAALDQLAGKALLVVLQGHRLSTSLLPKTSQLSQRSHGIIQSSLLRLISAVALDDFDLDRVKPLLREVVSEDVDELAVWNHAESAAAETTPPPRTPASSLQQTPWLHTTNSFVNSSEHRKYVDGILKQELGTVSVDVPGFQDAYFHRVAGLQAASLDFFDLSRQGDDPLFRDGWKGWPHAANEADVLRWLRGIVQKLSEFGNARRPDSTLSRRLLVEPNQPIQGSTAESKLDVGLVHHVDGRCESHAHWQDVLVPGELKRNPSADTISKAWLDLGRYAKEVFTSQDNRRFVLGFTLCGSLMRIWAFDRLGAIASKPFDINRDGLQFVITMLGFLWMDEKALGYDPKCRTADEEWLIEVNRHGAAERIVLGEVILRPRCIVGRATTCWKAHPEGHPETPLVVKESWQYPERDVEGEFLKEATNRGVANVARHYHHETVQFDGADDDIRSNVRRGLDITTGHQPVPRRTVRPEIRASASNSGQKRTSSQRASVLPPNKRSRSTSPIKPASPARPLPNRVRRRVILRDYGKHIYEASSPAMLLASLAHGVEGHRSLRDIGLLHRDISTNNILINEQSGSAFLIDLDLAVRLHRQTASGAQGKTGTRAFMAIGALLNEPHSFMHDLESFFWVLFWICIHYGPNGKDHGTSAFEHWNYEDDAKLAVSKQGVVADEADFLETVQRNFTAHYQPLIPLVNRLRRVVFPNGKRRRQSNLDLYSSMVEILRSMEDNSEVLE